MIISRPFLLSLRLLPAAALRRPYPSPPSLRHFTFSPRSQAAETDSFITAFKHTAIFQKLADKPEALIALTNFAKLLQEKGVDISGGSMPSTTQMLRLAASSDFRNAAKRVVEELQKAGVDINSQEAMEQIMNMKKPGGS